MPDDRMFHKRLGHSEKVCGLTDFEFRVWVQYQLSADDFGVMRLSAITIQADNDVLAKPVKTKAIQRTLERLIEPVRLVREFVHQGRHYVFQHDWQDFQKVEYPRGTINPKPPADVLRWCSEMTQHLFGFHPGGVRVPSMKYTKTLPEDFGNITETVPDLARAGARQRLTANGERLTANGVEGVQGEKRPAKERPTWKGQTFAWFAWMEAEFQAALKLAKREDFELHGWRERVDAEWATAGVKPAPDEAFKRLMVRLIADVPLPKPALGLRGESSPVSQRVAGADETQAYLRRLRGEA